MSEIDDAAERSLKNAKEKLLVDPIVWAVEAIEVDICDRRGLKGEWAQIESHIQEEIKAVWREIIRQALKEAQS